MVKKSTTSIRESKSKRYKLKKKICKLLDSTNKEDFLIGLELCTNLSEMKFRNILKSCQGIQKVDINGFTVSKNGAVYFYKEFREEVFQDTNDGYSQILANHYIEYGLDNIYIDAERYVRNRVGKDSDNPSCFFENKKILKYFLKRNPQYAKYFKK